MWRLHGLVHFLTQQSSCWDWGMQHPAGHTQFCSLSSRLLRHVMSWDCLLDLVYQTSLGDWQSSIEDKKVSLDGLKRFAMNHPMSRQKFEHHNGMVSAVAWGSTRVSMINLVDLAGSEKVRQVDGSHTEHDPVFCTACFASAWSLTNPGSNISNDNSHAMRDFQGCFLWISKFRWNRLGLKENVWRKALWSTNLCASVFSLCGRWIQIRHVEWSFGLGVPWATASKSSRRNLQIQRRQRQMRCAWNVLKYL